MELLAQRQSVSEVLGEAGWGPLSPISALKMLTEVHRSRKLNVAFSEDHFSTDGPCQIFPAQTQGLIYPLRSAFHVSLPKEGLGQRQTPATVLTSHSVLAGYFCWNRLHLLPLYSASSPDILLCSYCQHCNEKWLFYYVCFHLNPSRKDLMFSSSLLLKLALASCRISGLDSPV